MLTIALMLALSQSFAEDEMPPDPFDHNLPPLSVNDTAKDAGQDPSFLHIGLCVGSDIDQKPVLIADRLCLNSSAVAIVNDAVATRTQDMVKLSNENEKLAGELISAISYAHWAVGLGIVLSILMFMAGVTLMAPRWR